MCNDLQPNRISRRAFLQGSTLVLAATAAGQAPTSNSAPKVRFGLITDLHYADKPPAGSRFYRETPKKLAEAVEYLTAERPDFTVELGDLIDAADDIASERKWLKKMAADVRRIPGAIHFVLGNHCVETLTKAEFLDGVGQAQSSYSFDVGQRHFVILDACFRSDGEPYGRRSSSWDDAHIPRQELDWLKSDLAATDLPTFVFAHQRLDGSSRHCIKNASAVRKVLEQSEKVQAVFQGHSHQNDYREINGIHYVTLVAMVEGSGAENSGYALVKVFDDHAIHVEGFRKQSTYRWPH